LKKGQYLSGTTASNLFTEEVTQYDKNGNIKTMKRYARNSPSDNTGTVVDDLTLTYSGNQLSSITDASTSNSTIGFVMPSVAATGSKVSYNRNGAMTQNYYNGIAGITYNVLNLPDRIQTMYGHNTTYSYDAAGEKRRVVHQTFKNTINIQLLGTLTYTPTASDIYSTLTTDYCANGHIVYENNNIKYILNLEGYVAKQSNGTYKYYYYAKDHLGNNRAVYNALSTTPGGLPTTFGGPGQETNYYPFGMPYQIVYAPSDGISPELQPYKFGGKEYDEMHGLKWYDFGARYYNGIIPGFSTTIDPLAELNYSVSPYCAFANNPIRYMDPTGRDTIDVNSTAHITGRRIGGNDVMNITNANGEVVSKDFGTDVFGKDVQNGYGTDDEWTVFEINGAENATSVFEFMGDNFAGQNNRIEFSRSEWETNDGKTLNLVSTSHNNRTDEGADQYMRKPEMNGGLFGGKYHLRADDHSHPSGARFAGTEDLNGKAERTTVANHFSKPVPTMRIYIPRIHKPNPKYIGY